MWILALRITELVFGPGRDGFNEETIELLHHLILRHNILVEEVLGNQKCEEPGHHWAK